VLTVGDFDGDGKPDVALMGQYVSVGTIFTTQYASAVWVYYGNGDQTFSQPVSAGQFLDNNYFHFAAGVLTESGRSDLIVAGDTFLTTGGFAANGSHVIAWGAALERHCIWLAENRLTRYTWPTSTMTESLI